MNREPKGQEAEKYKIINMKKMKKDCNHKNMVPVTPANIWHYIVYWFIFWMIRKNKFNNINRFKPGDYVKYNWRAKHHIDTIYRENRQTFIISRIINYRDGSQNCEFKSDPGDDFIDGCSVFWITRSSRREYWKHRKLKTCDNRATKPQP